MKLAHGLKLLLFFGLRRRRAIFMLLQRHSQSVYAYPLCEHVPDLTSQDDLPVVRDYLGKHFGD